MNIPHLFTHMFTDVHRGFSTFWTWRIFLLWIFLYGICLNTCLQFWRSTYILRNRIAGFYNNPVFPFWETDKLFSSVLNYFTFLSEMCKSPNFCIPSPTFISTHLWMITTLMGVTWYFIVVWFHFLMTSDVEHLFRAWRLFVYLYRWNFYSSPMFIF